MSEDKDNGISIIGKNNEERYPHRVLLIRNQGSTLFADGDTPNAIITFNFWKEHGLIIVYPDRPRQFRLNMISQEQLLVLNYM